MCAHTHTVYLGSTGWVITHPKCRSVLDLGIQVWGYLDRLYWAFPVQGLDRITMYLHVNISGSNVSM